MENKKKWVGWILIAGILIITATALGVNTLAGDRDGADAGLQQHEAALRELFPQASQFERLNTDEGGFICRVTQGTETAGYAVQQTVQGYGGPIEVITGVQPDGTIVGIRVGGSEFRETDGLGAKAKDADFIDQFKGKALPVTLGQDIDAISGATVTSQAVVDAVNLTQQRMQAVPGVDLAPGTTVEPEASDAGGMTANASAIGYGGPVLVRLTLDEQGAIRMMDVGGARFAETEGVGSRVKDEAFTQQFIGLTPPLTLHEDVDAVSGATVSSQAVVDAVNDAHAFLTQNNAPSDMN